MTALNKQTAQPHADNSVKTGRSPESLPSGMVLFSISFCFSSGSAGETSEGQRGNQWGAKGNRQRENNKAHWERYFSVVRHEREVRGRLKWKKLTGWIKKNKKNTSRHERENPRRKLMMIFKNAPSPHYLAAAVAKQAAEWLTVCKRNTACVCVFFSLLIGSQSFPV